jgi:hypothetical protein
MAGSASAVLALARVPEGRLPLLAPLLGRAGALAEGVSTAPRCSPVSVASAPVAPSSGTPFSGEDSSVAAGAEVVVRADFPRPPRLRRRRGFGAWVASTSSGWTASPPSGSAAVTTSPASVSAGAERAADRPPRERRRRWPPAVPVRVPAPSSRPSVAASRAGAGSRSTSSLGRTEGTATPPSGKESCLPPCWPVALAWSAGRRPDLRLRRRLGRGVSPEGPPSPDREPRGAPTCSSSGAAALSICSLNARPFLFQDRAQARALAAQEA